MKEMLRPITVFMTGAGTPGAPGVIKCLRKNGERNIRIIGADMNENASCRTIVDAFYKIPAAGDAEFVDEVFNICVKEKAVMVLSGVTKELEKLAAARERFEAAGVRLSTMDLEPLHIANNKGLLLNAMKEAGMPTPDFRVVHTAEEVASAIEELGYPERALVVKPTFGNGSRGTRILDANLSRYDLFFNQKPNSMHIGYGELMETLKSCGSIPEMMVMEYLPGEEYGVDALCENGETLCMVGRYNFSVNSSIPQGCIIEEREEPFEIAKKIIRLLKLSGNVNFDFMYDSKGNAYLLEINPRMSATITAYAPAGVNLPYLRVKQLLGEPLEFAEIANGTRMQRRYTEIFFDADGNELPW